MAVMKLVRILTLVSLLVLTIGTTYAVRAGGVPAVEVPPVKFEGGQVNKLSVVDGSGWVVVDWTKFVITPETKIIEQKGMLKPYVFVDVEAVRYGDMLVAYKIEVLSGDPGMVIFEGGRISKLALDMGTIKVCGTKFTITADTRLDEGLMLGDTVRVEAVRMDHMLTATRVTLLDTILR